MTESDGTTAISGATVVVEGTSLSTTTDGNGDYSIGNVPEGTHDVTASTGGVFSETFLEMDLVHNHTVLWDTDDSPDPKGKYWDE